MRIYVYVHIMKVHTKKDKQHPRIYTATQISTNSEYWKVIGNSYETKRTNKIGPEIFLNDLEWY